ncbi:hypothetical protein AB0425_35255, partial [Actinosynnema sp. NPDC051121]
TTTIDPTLPLETNRQLPGSTTASPTSWPHTASPYGVYGPFLSPLEAYRAERQAESLDRITERLDAARQADDDQRQAIRTSLARARQARAAKTNGLRETVRDPADNAVDDVPDRANPVHDRLRQARRQREAPQMTGVSERLTQTDDPGLWSVEELLPAAEAELVDDPPPSPRKERESDGE